MLPIAPLMIEHRLIDKMPAVLAQEAMNARSGRVDPERIDALVGFMRNYADRCHHGKEEDILFRELSTRPMPQELRGTMEALIKDHEISRQNVRSVAAANQRYRAGEAPALRDMAVALEALAGLYPRHIATEDRDFFIPCMELFSPEERRRMLAAFQEFDRRLVHETYRAAVSGLLGRELAPTPEARPGDEAPVKGAAVCRVCDYVYDPAKGDPDHGVPPGTQLDDLPEDWTCPLCGAGKAAFRRM